MSAEQPTLTPEKLAELERLEKEATPAPFTCNDWSAQGSHSVAISANGGADGDGYILAEIMQEDEQALVDGKLLTALRNSAPALLAMARETAELREELEQERKADSEIQETVRKYQDDSEAAEGRERTLREALTEFVSSLTKAGRPRTLSIDHDELCGCIASARAALEEGEEK